MSSNQISIICKIQGFELTLFIKTLKSFFILAFHLSIYSLLNKSDSIIPIIDAITWKKSLGVEIK
jgi:hypothetical protein